MNFKKKKKNLLHESPDLIHHQIWEENYFPKKSYDSCPIPSRRGEDSYFLINFDYTQEEFEYKYKPSEQIFGSQILKQTLFLNST